MMPGQNPGAALVQAAKKLHEKMMKKDCKKCGGWYTGEDCDRCKMSELKLKYEALVAENEIKGNTLSSLSNELTDALEKIKEYERGSQEPTPPPGRIIGEGDPLCVQCGMYHGTNTTCRAVGGNGLSPDKCHYCGKFHSVGSKDCR